MRAGFRATTLSTLLLASASSAALLSPAAAQSFSALYAFGDSYADNGNLFKITGTSSPIYPTGRFSGGTNFIDTTSQVLGLPQVNFAIGGAKTGTTNTVAPGIPGFAQEWAGFIAAGGRFAPTDVVAISIGGNDARAYYQGGGTLAGVPAASAVSAAQATAGIYSLAGVGAKTIVFTAGDVGKLPEAAAFPATAPIGSAYSAAYNTQMQASLAALARSGVRIEYVDLSLIGAAVAATSPALTGITNLGACPAACVGNPALQAQYQFYVDGIHLTSAAFGIVGEYVVNRLNAPLTFAQEGELGMVATTGFIGTMFGRLDLFGAERGPTIVPAPLAYAPVRKGPLETIPVAPPSPLSVYMLVNGGGGSRKSNAFTNGYEYESLGGTIGMEYRFGREAMLGGAFQYSNPVTRAYGGLGTTRLDSYQFGVYGAWTRSNFFAQGLFSYGFQSLKNSRPGVLLGPLTSSPSGTSVAGAGKVGYLFDTGFSFIRDGITRIGPIAGVTYASSRTNAYTESGDPALALAVGTQRVQALVGSAGVQLRNAFPFWGNTFETFTNLTAEYDFKGPGRTVDFGAVSAPLIINTWGIPNPSTRLYGRMSSGFSAGIGNGMSISINTTSTVGRRGGNDYGGQGGLKIVF